MSWLESRDNDAAQESSTHLLWARFDGSAWSDPEEIYSGGDFFVNWADFPSLAGGGEAPVAAHWLRKVPGGTYAYHVNMAFRNAPGSWAEPFTLHDDRSETEHGFVSLVPLDGDRVFAIWLDGYKTGGAGHGGDTHHEPGSGLESAMTLRSAVVHRDGRRGPELEVDGAVCDCCQTSAALAGNRVVAVYRDRTEGEIRDTYRALYDLDAGRWSEPEALSSEGWEIAGCPVNGPQVAAQGDTVIATWFTGKDNRPRTYLAVSRDGGHSFGAPQALDQGESMGRLGISFNAEGVALLTWIGTEQAPGKIYGRLWRNNRVEPPFEIGTIDGSRASGFPRSAAVGEDFVVAWTRPGSGFQLETVVVDIGGG